LSKQLENWIAALCLTINLIAIPAGCFGQGPKSSDATPHSDRTNTQQTVLHAELTLDAISKLIGSIQTRRENEVRDANPARHVFDDVPKTDQAYADVTVLEQHHVLLGYPSGHFSGRRILTRYEFAVAVHRMLQFPGVLTSISSRETQAPIVPASYADLLLISRLLEEFNAELHELGRNVQNDRAQLKTRITQSKTH